MEEIKLEKWAELLLDTGKRNNLINFKDSKSQTVEILVPDYASLFHKVESVSSLEIYDPKINEDAEAFQKKDFEQLQLFDHQAVSKKDFYNLYSLKIKKNNQILVYNPYIKPIKAVKNIYKKAKEAIEETGVNIVYIAFGFVNWKERDDSQIYFKAPILLIPITITNESAIDPYYIHLSNDEIIVNPTFQYKLQNEYGLNLPEYEDEDINVYFNKLEIILGKLNWNLEKVCKIGVFSFLKINMYRDLKDNKQKIVDNKVIKCLIGENEQDLAETIKCNGEYQVQDLLDLHNVVDADSSQAEAIELAKKGKSFVLQGPPGTGKSQTITNIIAECLHDGKKILFVSEKLAALNVVYEKLKKAGLSEFCLELHSYKANKKAVIEELCHTLKLEKSSLSSRAANETALKKKNEKILNEYAEELHRTNAVINKSLYQLYNLLSSCRNSSDLKYEISLINEKGEDFLDNILTLIEQYEQIIAHIGYDYHNNFWYGYNNLDTSYQKKISIESNFKSLIAFIDQAVFINNQIEKDIGISYDSINSIYQSNELFLILKNSQFITPYLLNLSNINQIVNTVKEMSIIADKIIKTKQTIESVYNSDIYKLDGNIYNKKLLLQYKNLISRLFSKEYKKMITELKYCRIDGKKLLYKKALEISKYLKIYQSDLQSYIELESNIKQFLGKGYCGIETIWKTMFEECDAIKLILEKGFNCKSLCSINYDEFLEKQPLMNDYYEQTNSLIAKYSSEITIIGKDFNQNFYDIYSSKFTNLKIKLNGCIYNLDQLENWCRFNLLMQKLQKTGEKNYIDIIINNKINPTEFVELYKKAFYTQWIEYIINNSEVLSEFSRIQQDKAVEMFSKKDHLQFEINKADIKAELSNLRPSLDMITAGSPISTLLREGEKKRKQKSIRLLLSEIGDLVQLIKPCFLMSPLSVSTFLSPEKISFDTVIFDEASQIFPQDAIGAIYRGKQLIVVGDSKQMPPSNFFGATIEDSDDETEDISDFESILDLCATSLPQLRLKWHYRSRYEQLISFSNKNFYDNSLITFPSSKTDSEGIGVDYYHTEGIFDHKSRTNITEAEKVVDLIYEDIRKYPERSLGVVAFSISQQDLIERLLSKRRQKDSLYEVFFKEDKKEPFFIKNLETVQGDERDVIIFSVAYGKDFQGRLLHNFGPLNRTGGERRLNVAVTRAKINVQLVSSMHYYDIDLTKTQSVGSRLLREYLDFAENGYNALQRTIKINEFEQFDSEFELEVCDFLRENGFSVDTQVGCSSFKIDLGLKMPNSSHYVLAIECDGASYHSSKTARDRDRLRQEILERMGWKFYRIWSTDWFLNTKTEKCKLLEVAKEAISKYEKTTEKNEEILETFEENKPVSHFEFPKYEMVNAVQIAKTVEFDKIKTIKKIIELEQPISEEWLLKRICFLYYREKVTKIVREEYEYQMINCDSFGIIRKNGFLYLKENNFPMLRVPKNCEKPRDIQYISIEELANGLYALLSHNISADKDSLYKTIAEQLGFSRIGDGIYDRLEKALQTLSSRITLKNNILSLK